MKRFGLLILGSVAAVVVAGCTPYYHPQSFGYGHNGSPVLLARDHVHSDYCGHYWHRGQWFHISGHTHGSGCGHFLRQGFGWVLEPADAHFNGGYYGQRVYGTPDGGVYDPRFRSGYSPR